jgi:hypothetical protein
VAFAQRHGCGGCPLCGDGQHQQPDQQCAHQQAQRRTLPQAPSPTRCGVTGRPQPCRGHTPRRRTTMAACSQPAGTCLPTAPRRARP